MVQVPINDSLHQLEAKPLKAIIEFAKYLITGGHRLSRPFQKTLNAPPTLGEPQGP